MRRLVALAILLVACSSAPAETPTTTADTTATMPTGSTTPPSGWRARAPMQLFRSEHPAVVVDGAILVFGGLFETSPGNSRVTDTVERYHPATDVWTSMPSLPQPRHHGMAVAVDDRVFFIGGYDAAGFNPVDTVWEMVGEEWLERAALPEPVGAGAAVVVAGVVYVVGGTPGGGLHTYQPAADTWTTASRPGTPREHLAAVAIDDEVWAIAGRWEGVIHDTIEIYDPATDTWRPGPTLNQARSGFGAAVVDGVVYVAGGEVFGPDQALITVERLAPPADTWELIEPLPIGLHGNPLLSLGTGLYLPGGSTRAGAVDNDGRLFSLEP
jgi:N-acetylneuraminic acid mutarotase